MLNGVDDDVVIIQSNAVAGVDDIDDDDDDIDRVALVDLLPSCWFDDRDGGCCSSSSSSLFISALHRDVVGADMDDPTDDDAERR